MKTKNYKNEKGKPPTAWLRILLVFAAILVVGAANNINAQPWTYNFGTGTGTYNTAGSTSTTFLPAAPSGNDFIRVGTGTPSFNLENSGLAGFGTNTEMRATSPSTTSSSKMSVYDYTTATKYFYTKFSVLFGSNTGTNTVTAGTWFFYQGDGALYSGTAQISSTLNQSFVTLRFVYSTGGVITAAYHNGSAWTTLGTITSQATIYNIEVYGNNTTAATTYERGGTQNLSNDKWDLWVNGSKIGTGLASGGIANNVNIDSWMFGSESTSTAANIFIDDIEYSNALPSCAAPAAPTASTHTPSETQVVWNWNAVGGATGYKYNTTNNYATATDNGTSTTFTQTGLTCNTAYNLYVWSYTTCESTTPVTLTSTTTACSTPTLSVGALTAFGNVCTNATPPINSFTITGSNLTAADVTVAALSGYTYSTTVGGTYTTTLSLAHAAGAYSQDIFVKFTPVASTTYNGDIVVGGGGATSVNRSTTGTGTTPVTQTVTSSAATSVATTTATLNGNVTTLGACPASTEKGFVWSLTSANSNPIVGGSGVTKVVVGTISTGAFTQGLTGLSALTGYSFNSYVYDGSTYVYGTVQTFTTTAVTYCTPTGSTLATTYVSNFTTTSGVTNINNTSTYSVAGYGDFTAQSASQYANTSIGFSATIVGPTVGIGLWVDWNKDGDFVDAGESVYNSAGYVSGVTSSFTVPAAQAVGDYRMRIIANYDAMTPTSCVAASTARGEAEDYTLSVVVPGPNLVVSPLTLSGFSYAVGSGPSAEQSFTVSGSLLTNDISIAATTSYEISTGTGGSFVATNPITLTKDGSGTVASTTIYVRQKAGISVGTVSAENIVVSSAGATSKNVACSGVVTDVPSIAISTPGVSAANVGQATSNHVIQKINLAVTVANATLTGVTVTTAGTYQTSDLVANSFKLWYSTDATFTIADYLISTQAIVATGNNVAFTGLSKAITNGNTGYLFITCDIAGAAVIGRTINIATTDFANITFAGGNKTGTDPVVAGGLQTIIAATPANVFISEVAGYGMATGTWNNEYIELTNNGGVAQDLTGWTLEYYGSSSPEATVTLTGSITANSAYVITCRATNTITENLLASPTFSMNEVCYVILKNAGGTIVDQAGTSTTKFLSDKNYEFVDCTNDNEPVANWSYLNQVDGTPGVVNCSSSPVITQSTTTLSGFSYGEGFGPSANQTYTVSGAFLTADLVVTASANYEVSLSSGAGFGSSVSITPSSGTVATTTIYVRQIAGLTAAGSPYTGTSTATSTGATNKVVNLSGTVLAKAITISTTTLTGFTYAASGGGPSAEQSFTVSGVALTGNLTITPPTDYEISTGTGGAFVATSPITLTPTNGVVSTTTIYVRLKASLSAGNYNTENIVCASSGATTQNVTCSGSVTVPVITFSVATASTNEGTNYTITVTSDLVGSHTANISLTGGTATNGSQFSYSSPVSATFAGSTTFTTVVTVANDAVCSGASSTAIFTLNGLSNCTTGANSVLTLTINDDDLLTGTYLSQTFEGVAGDTWGYTGDATNVVGDFNKKIGSYSYRFNLVPDDNLEMDNVDITGFTNVSVTAYFACTGLDSGEDLVMDVSYDGGLNYYIADRITLITGGSDKTLNTTATTSSNKYTFNVPADKTQIRLLFKTKADLGASEYSYIDNVSISRTYCNNCTEPTSDATMSSTSSITTTTASLNWTGGNGDASFVVMSPNAITFTPSDNSTYNANTIYGSGSEVPAVSSGQFVVYKAASTTAAITNLTPGTEYNVKLWEYSCLIGSENYLTSGTPATTQFITLPAVPATFVETCVANTSMTFNWTAPATGSLTGYMLVARQTSATDAVTGLNPNTQTFNTDFSSAPTYASSKVVYKGTDLTTTITGLTKGATYNFTLYTYKIGTSGYQYSAPTNVNKQINLYNVTSATAQKGDSQGTITWTNPTLACFDEILVVVNEAAGIGFTPSGTTYTGNTVYAGVNSIAYFGTGTSVVVTGLTNTTPYYFEIFTRNGTEWSSGVEVTCTPNTSTVLYPADLAIIAVNTEGTNAMDEICFISFVDITDVTAIDFTDNGYGREFADKWGNTEGVLRLQRTGGGTIPAGTPICFTGERQTANFTVYVCGINDMANWTVIDLDGDLGSTNYDLNTADQIWIMQNGNWDVGTWADHDATYSGNILYGWTATGWKNTTGISSIPVWDSNGSMLFPGSDCFNTYVSVSSNPDKVKYTGPLTPATQSEWISRINDGMNWTGYASNGAYDVAPRNYIGSGSCALSFPVTATIDHSVGSNGLWTGEKGVDWFDCNNWADKTLPSKSSNVVIPATSSNNVEIDDGNGIITEANCNNLTLQDPAISLSLTHALSIINIYGNFTNNAVFNHSLGTVLFKGTNAQSISGTAVTSFNDLTINNTSSTGLTLNRDITINGVLTLTDGNIYSFASNGLITMNNASSISGSGANSYINGPMKKIGNTAFEFPLGKTRWAPIAISATADINDAFTANYFNAMHSDTANHDATIDHISRMDYWDITRNAGTSNPTITLFWKDNRYGIVDMSQLVVAHYKGGTWKDMGMAGSSGTNSLGSIQNSIPFTSFSPIALATKIPSNPLPIELIYFNGKRVKSEVLLKWATASEINNNYFAIERSADNVNFYEIGKVNGAGNSNVLNKYQFVDANPLNTITYYRFKQYDFDGKQHNSNTIVVESLNNKSFYIDNYTSVDGNMSFILHNTSKSKVEISIYDMIGNEISRKTIENEAGVYPVNISDIFMRAGVYNLILNNQSEVIRYKVFVK